VRAVTELLTSGRTRLITLTGPGGVGKNRLALAIGHALASRYAETSFVPLETVTDPAQVSTAIAAALRIRLSGARPALDAVGDAIGNRPVLLLLDNFEQVSSAATDVATLLSVCPHLSIVVTSRSQLRLNAEHVYPVRPLPVPPAGGVGTADRLDAFPAGRLFMERAAAAGRRFRIGDDDATAVAELTRRLDGLPLAIELVAARTRLLPPAGLLARLRDRLDEVVSGGGTDLPARQRGLRATIEWSHELLAPHERVLFARLGALPGGFTLESAEWLCPDGSCGDVLDALSALIDQSLVEADQRAPAGPRFRMLETIRG